MRTYSSCNRLKLGSQHPHPGAHVCNSRSKISDTSGLIAISTHTHISQQIPVNTTKNKSLRKKNPHQINVKRYIFKHELEIVFSTFKTIKGWNIVRLVEGLPCTGVPSTAKGKKSTFIKYTEDVIYCKFNIR